jgi:hypothetical protein
MDARNDLLAKDANTLTTLEWAVILHVTKEKAEQAAAELARLQAIEAAARVVVLTDGRAESVRYLAAALERKP